MPKLSEISAKLPEFAQSSLSSLGNSSYTKHFTMNQKHLNKASIDHPYSVFDSAFSMVSAQADICGISAASQNNANYPNGIRTDILVQFTQPIVGKVFTCPDISQSQSADLLRIRDRGNRVQHPYPATTSGIKSYETLEKLYPDEDD